MVVDQDVATAIAKLTQTYQDRQQELNEVSALNRKLKKQGKET